MFVAPGQPRHLEVADAQEAECGHFVGALRCAQGWVNLCAVRDSHSRRVLGYAMGGQHSTDLVITALDMAVTTRGGLAHGVVLHADRGMQFTSQNLAAYMRAVKGTVSMGWAEVCWDNAMAESFWATLKTEYYYRRTVTTRDRVYTRVATWMEDFYNCRRIHTSLGGKSPSKTSYTKRPTPQPHKYSLNNLRTSPAPTEADLDAIADQLNDHPV